MESRYLALLLAIIVATLISVIGLTFSVVLKQSDMLIGTFFGMFLTTVIFYLGMLGSMAKDCIFSEDEKNEAQK